MVEDLSYLVELCIISLLQRYPGVGLVHCHCEAVPHSLHRQVLSDGLELLAAVAVVLPLHPGTSHTRQRFLRRDSGQS